MVAAARCASRFAGSFPAPSKAPGTKDAYLAAFATFAGSGVLNFQLVDLFIFGSLRCTAIEEVLRNSPFSFRSGRAWLQEAGKWSALRSGFVPDALAFLSSRYSCRSG